MSEQKRGRGRPPGTAKANLRYEDLPEIMDVATVARFLKIDRNLCYQMVHEGEIPSFRFGRIIRIAKMKLGQMLGYEQAVS